MKNVKVDYSLILQASKMLQNESVKHPITTLVEFDSQNENINLIDETTQEVYYTEIYGIE